MENDEMDVAGQTVDGDTITGTDGEDFIEGTEGNDQIFGLGEFDDISGLGGDDLINGGAGDDFINGDEGDDTLIGESGDDVLIGDFGNDIIDGGDGNDDLDGSIGNDSIFGGAGDDIIFAGPGNDYLVGGDGADIFVFDLFDGHSTIADFEIGIDELQISETLGFSAPSIDDFAEIEDQLIQDGDDTLIAINANQSIRLLDTQVDDLLAATPVDDGDIPGDSSTTATISVGQTIESTLAPSRDVDAFALSLEAGQNINISHEGGRQVTLRDADGNIVASSFTDFRTGTFSGEDFVFQAEEADTYFLTVESFIPSSVSDDDLIDTPPIDYSVTVTEFADDHGNFASNATPLSQGNNIIEGQFEHIEDSDAFAIALTEGQVLSLDLDENVSLQSITVLGPDGEDATGLALDTTVTREGRINSQQQIVATEDGVYTIIVDSRNGFFDPTAVIPENPDYTLTTSVLGDARLELDNDIGDTLADATQILSGDTIVSDISSVDDTDVFAIDLTAGQTLSLSTVTDFDQVANILDADGNIVAEFPSTSSDSIRSVFQGELDFTAEDSGTFFISITNDVDGSIDQLYFLEANIAGGAPANIVGTDGADTLVGTAGDDVISGAGGSDAIFGGAGDDIIDSGTGNDYLVGGDGADVYVFNEGDGHDTIDGFEIGVDSLEISGVRIDNLSDISPLLSQDGQDVLIGLSAEQSIRLLDTQLDELLAGEAPSTPTPIFVEGTDGNDVLIGGDGSQTLLSGGISGGNDVLTGGAGADIFAIEALEFDDQTSHDVITDFEQGVDTIDVTFLAGLSGNQVDNPVISFEDLFITNNDNGDVAIYLSEDQSVTFQGQTDLAAFDATDFLFFDGPTDTPAFDAADFLI